MSYVKLTDFAAKDALLSGNPSKLLRGTEIGAEFDAIESAMAAAEAVNITAPIIAASTSKTTPVDADVLPILDSAAANILKKVNWANIKATLKTYFDTLYAAVGSFAASGANADITSLTALTSPVSEVRQLQPITAAIASNAITVTPSALSLEFRNTTLTNGAVSFVEGTPSALVIAATDSFGLVTAAGNQRIAILAINNAGTIELAASALAGGVSLDETGVITTATAATLGAHIKAANVHTGVAYRVIGFVDATFTTATGWGSLALVQGTGGQALAAMSSLGYGSSISPGAALNTTYYNTKGRPLALDVIVSGHETGAGVTLSVAGQTRQQNFCQAISSSAGLSVFALVNPGQSYVVTSTGSVSLTSWKETT
jgi:hypothetical protein